MSLENKSYCSLAEADSYWSDRNNTDWAEATESARSAALIRATEWIDTSFSWPGYVKADDQVLSWPRIHAYDREGRLRKEIPQELKNAVAWLANESLSGNELDPAQERGGQIRNVKAGSVAVEWNPGAPAGKSYRHVRTMLRNIITNSVMRRG